MSITIGTVTLRNPNHESRWDYRKYSQTVQAYEDGSFETYQSGRTMIDVELFIDYISEADFDSFVSWLTNTVNFSRHQFTVTPPSFLNLGLGKGVAITNATYTGPANTKDIYKPVGRLGYKNLNFTFSYPKPIDVSVVDANGVISV